MKADTTQPKLYDKATLFELARDIYALHCAIRQLTHAATRSAYREKLNEMLNQKTNTFSSYGGIIETGFDSLGERGPILSFPEPKEVIPYGIGRLGCEQLLNH